MRRTKFSARPGFTITEILIALSLLILFFAAASELFKSTVLLSAGGSQLTDQTAQTDSAIFQLRQDVWNSRSITVKDSHSVDLVSATGSTISWKIDPENSLARDSVQSSPQHWTAPTTGLSFSTNPSTLMISDGTPAPICMISQLLLAQGSQP